jgi:hypothetical protein
MESADYHSPRPASNAVPAPLVVLSADPTADAARTSPLDSGLGVLPADPPECLMAWQFSARTALLPRAPSFAS